MPCPFSGDVSGPGAERDRSGPLSRRDFAKAALAIGGASALSACVEFEGRTSVPRGTGHGSLPTKQHAWNEYLPQDSHGNVTLPAHQLLLFLEYDGPVPPDDRQRSEVESALRSLERAYQFGNGGDDGSYDEADGTVDGLLFTLAYARRYFDRFDATLPSSVDLPRPESVLNRLDEDAAAADDHDAVLVMCSDHVDVLLSAEQALFEHVEALNGVSMQGTLSSAFSRSERRTGFIGAGLPRRRLDNDDIPQESPQAMGYVSGFRENQAHESAVAISEGPFAGGTTQHVSRLVLDLDRWYDLDDDQRTRRMFSPGHSVNDVGDVGEFLASDSGITREDVQEIDQNADEHGIVGHTQKVARARTDDFEPRILRRSEGVSTDLPEPAMNFSSVQEGIGDFVKTREAMTGDEFDVDDGDNGIDAYIEVRNRGNYLLPPRSLRSLPTPSPETDE